MPGILDFLDFLVERYGLHISYVLCAVGGAGAPAALGKHQIPRLDLLKANFRSDSLNKNYYETS